MPFLTRLPLKCSSRSNANKNARWRTKEPLIAQGYGGETHEQSRRRPTAFLRQHQAQEWTPDVRKELADVREGIHKVINAMFDSAEVSLREKAVLHLLQSTGARLHEIVLMTVGGYQNKGIAGQAQVMNKGSYGREIKNIYWADNPRVQEVLNDYLEQVRPLHDPQKQKRLADVDPKAPLFLTERGTPYSPKAFYYHWYRCYVPLQITCPVPFSPHDLRHLFVTENLIRLKIKCRLGTDHFDSDTYLSEREAFGSQVMCWRSAKTINIYDQSRRGESVFSTLAEYQKDLSQRRYDIQATVLNLPPEQNASSVISRPVVPSTGQETPIIWWLDAETLDWIKRMEQQAKPE
jgi:hypothetical protein